MISLEKNRQAAAKRREKKKAVVDKLKDALVAAKSENSLLKQQVTKLREEILNLCGELITQVFSSECCEQEKLRTALGVMGSEVTPGSQVGANEKVFFGCSGG